MIHMPRPSWKAGCGRAEQFKNGVPGSREKECLPSLLAAFTLSFYRSSGPWDGTMHIQDGSFRSASLMECPPLNYTLNASGILNWIY